MGTDQGTGGRPDGTPADEHPGQDGHDGTDALSDHGDEEHDLAWNELPLLLMRAVRVLHDDVMARTDDPAAAASSGFTPMHAIAARHIASTPRVTVVELASYLRITKQSASEIVGALERGGFVRRRPHPDDRRARVIEITELGSAGLVRSRRLWGAVVDDWQDLVGAEALATVTEAIEAYLDAHPPTA